VQDSPDQPLKIQVAVSNLVAEYIGPLIDAFTARDSRLEIEIDSVQGTSFADLLEYRRADIALGPHPGAERAATIASVPFLRCRAIIVAALDHPLAGRHDIPPAALAEERWLVGPPDLDPTTTTGLFFARNGLTPSRVSAFTNHAAALAAAAAGEGIILTLAHSVVEEVRRRALVRIDVRGTPIVDMWHASTLGLGRALPAALALQRFATTSEATQAMSTGRAGSASTRVRPTVHVTLWRSVAAGVEGGGRR
jgi:DNA-binding transcriptional LysR family regulator